MRRTGQVGSLEAPAREGEGLVWVDVELAVDHALIANHAELDVFWCGPDDFTDEDRATDYDSGHEYDGALGYFRKMDERALGVRQVDVQGGAPVSHESFSFGSASEAEPDSGGSPDAVTVQLPEVEIPTIAQDQPVRHDDRLPMLISAGNSGYDRIEIAPEAELVIRGPATVQIGSLVLEPGAVLTLDARAGEVSPFVTREPHLQARASVATARTDPGGMSVQVSSTASDPLDSSVKLDSFAQFHGNVYAPRTDVRIGTELQISGA